MAKWLPRTVLIPYLRWLLSDDLKNYNLRPDLSQHYLPLLYILWIPPEAVGQVRLCIPTESW